ncbi:MAG: porin family protein [Psychroflexus sp.]|nr:porin family protein [Psychroflexus sp.]MDN6310378.1 porin family protein [Psychroflexus sp.]
MKMKHISIFIISSLLFISQLSFAQTQDSITYKERYGLTIGTDLSKLGRSLFDDDYQGFEVFGDYRLTKNLYIAAEIGNEEDTYNEENLVSTAKGSYIKAGVNYNVYENWIGMQNIIYIGARAGFASFNQNIEEYTVSSSEHYFDPDVRNETKKFDKLTASWVEMKAGIRVEVLKNLYLGAHVQLKVEVSSTELNNFDNLYIPGFNRTYDSSSVGTGWGYSISYMIPLFTKTRVQKID